MTGLRIETSTAGAYEDATEADLDRWVTQLDTRHPYVVLHRADKPKRFAQARVRSDARFDVEYNLASGKIKRTCVGTTDEVRALLAGWAFDRRGWNSGVAWETDPNDTVVDFQAGCEWSSDGDDVVVAFTPLGISAHGATRQQALAQLLLVLEDATQDRPTALKFSEWATANLKPQRDIPRQR